MKNPYLIISIDQVQKWKQIRKNCLPVNMADAQDTFAVEHLAI
jgi:hypothetical protein